MPLATPMHGQKHGHALSLNRIRAPVGRASRTRYNVQAMARKSLFGSGPQEMSKYIKPGSTTLRLIRCSGTGKESETDPTSSSNGAAATAQQVEDNSDAENAYDDEDIVNNPLLQPLREALMRARQKRDEAAQLREEREAKAQEVAQLAVEAETICNAAKKSLDELAIELATAEAYANKLNESIARIQAQIVSEGSAAAKGSVDFMEATLDFASSRSSSDAASADGGTVDDAIDVLKSLEEDLATKLESLETVKATISDLEDRIATQQNNLSQAEEAYREADGIAGVAMESTEEAVRNEMKYIALCNDTEGALVNAIEDIKYLEDSSEQREQDFDTRNMMRTMDDAEAAAITSAAAATTAAASAPSGTQDAAAVGAGAQASKSSSSEKAAAAAALRDEGLDEFGKPKPLTLQRRVQIALLLAKRHAALIAGVTAMLALGGYVLHQQGVFAALAAKAQAAAVVGGKIWTVTCELLKKLPLPHVHESEAGILETIWLLLASVIMVPLITKLPGGSPVLGFLASGAIVGPYALGIIQDVESIRHLAELGVVFLLFNIGLELSFDRLRSMGKFVFGMGTAQVVMTMAAVSYIGLNLLGATLGGPGAIILGGGLALSTTAVGMQVLQDRGETGSRHGRAAFSVLLLQDFAVVVLLMLIPLLAPGPDAAAGAAGLTRLLKAIGFASIKAVVCMGAIIVTGRTFLQPIYKRVADTNNPDLFAALTLLVVLSTSLITQVAGLSLALGAFLAGLLLAETDYHIQVESDIGPYKGLLMGLFFMTVGMEISVPLFFAKLKTVVFALASLICGKVAVMMVVGKAFGLSPVQSLRSGLLLSPGGEFAFVLFGEAVGRNIMNAALVKELYLVVALSMALTPFLAEFGGKLARMLEKSDMKTLQPKEGEMSGMSGHVIIAGYGRSGQLIAQMLAEELIPFVALDTNAARVQEGKSSDLPLYFGDAGSPAVLHALGADRAACAVITLDSTSANYRSVYTMHKHFPLVKTYCRAHTIEDGIMLERAGATAVVPEVLEPSLQLAAAVLSELNLPEDDVAETIRSFRKKHLAELQMLAQTTGSSLGYGDKNKEASSSSKTASGDATGGIKEAVA